MEKADAELQAARDMIAALDLYEVKFQDMVSSRMEPSAYEDVSRRLSDLRGTPSQFTGNIGALHDHENSLDRLRSACKKLITQRTRGSRKPPAAPSEGL